MEGWKQREVARYLEISHVFYGEIERGKDTRTLAPKHWKKLIEILPNLKLKRLVELRYDERTREAQKEYVELLEMARKREGYF